MTTREWWKNCDIDLEADSEILAIDSLEDQIAPIAANVSKIRELMEAWKCATTRLRNGLATYLEQSRRERPVRDWAPERLAKFIPLKSYRRMPAAPSQPGLQDVPAHRST